MEEYNLQEIRIEDYNSIKEYYQMRRPETADSNILDLYIWLNCYPTWYFTNDKGLMWVAKSEDGQYQFKRLNNGEYLVLSDEKCIELRTSIINYYKAISNIQ